MVDEMELKPTECIIQNGQINWIYKIKYMHDIIYVTHSLLNQQAFEPAKSSRKWENATAVPKIE